MQKNQMEYKGYIGTVEWYDDQNIFKGEVIRLKNNLTYEGDTIDQLRNNFHKCIDNYIKVCVDNNIKPEIPFKGSFNIRIDEEMHKLLSERANKEGVSINKIINKALKEYTDSYYLK